MAGTAPNGSITPKTKLPLSLVSALIAAAVTITAAWVRVEFRLSGIEEALEVGLSDRFRGADAVLFAERLQHCFDEHSRETGSPLIVVPDPRPLNR